MQGAGNDFVVLDETRGLLGLTPAHYRLLADRHFGIGADQILTVRAAPAPGIDFEYVIHNADGAEVEQCGNGARCFARFVRDQGLCAKDTIRVQTRAGVIEPQLLADGRVTVNMGAPVFALAEIPFDPAGLAPQACAGWEQWPLVLLNDAVHETARVAVVSMGNPHAVFFVPEPYDINLRQVGHALERNPLFPERANISVARIESKDQITLRVWERGAGETLACGTAACATLVAAHRRGLTGREATIDLPGGTLFIKWRESDNHVLMTGPVATSFVGTFDSGSYEK